MATLRPIDTHRSRRYRAVAPEPETALLQEMLHSVPTISICRCAPQPQQAAANGRLGNGSELDVPRLRVCCFASGTSMASSKP